jgi:TolB-like protein
VALERAVERAPANADCWALLSWIYSHEHAHGFNPLPGSLDRALAAARRAVDLAPSNHVAQQALAVALFFRRDIAGCRSAAERALALNPLDGSNEAIFLITFTGDWDRGCGLIRWAMEQNPHHPRWYGLILAINEYRVANYRGALDEAVKANMPDGHWKAALLAAAYGQLGDVDAARAALRTQPASEGDFARSARELLGKWLDPQLVEHVMDGLQKAERAAPAAGAGERTPIPGFGGRPALAVLPFENLSGDPEQQYFADGLAEDLITRLSRWRSFPVIARNSSFVHRGNAIDVKQVGADLGARYVVEGSVRKANSRVRISAQLIDTNTAQHVWARTYDRELTDVLEVQDELSEALAASLAGGLERAETARARRRPSDSLAAWDLYQRALPLAQSFTREGALEARALLERAILLDPQFSAAFARLASVGVWEVLYSWTDDPDRTLAAAITQARRATALDPDDA